MNIVKVEIEVIKMTKIENDDFWQEWQNHYITNNKVHINGHEVLLYNTDDGNNCVLLNLPTYSKWFDVWVD